MSPSRFLLNTHFLLIHLAILFQLNETPDHNSPMGNSSMKQSKQSNASSLVESALAAHPVVIFSKTFCPYCQSAKSQIAMAAKSIPNFPQPQIFELDRMGSTGHAIQRYLAETTGRSTVPNVFIAGKSIGGGDEVASLARSNQLKSLLERAPAKPNANTQTAMDPAQLVQDAISKYPVLVFSKSWCPFCVNAKSTLARVGSQIPSYKSAKVFELDNMSQGDQIQAHLASITGHRTVPSIFIGGKFIGGNDDLSALDARDQLKDLLATAPEQLRAAPQSSERAPPTPEEEVEMLVEQAIVNNPVVVFSKTWCGFCTAAKAQLAATGAQIPAYKDPLILELDKMGKQGAIIQEYLYNKTGQSTVPNIFIGGKFIGGSDVISGLAAREELMPLLTQASMTAEPERTTFAVAAPVVATAIMPTVKVDPAEVLVEQAIKTYPVVVFSKTYCPFCITAKRELERAGAEVAGYESAKIYELDEMGEEGYAIQNYLHEKTGRRTVPNVFIGGVTVGGGDETEGYAERNVLKQMLTQAPDKIRLLNEPAVNEEAKASDASVPEKEETAPAIKEIVFGAGCFWGVELAFQRAHGVVKTEVGYSNGDLPRVTYEAVCTGRTGSAEVVRVWYDPAVTSLEALLELWESRHDPTSKNKQGNDVGTQYRSGVYYTDADQLAVIKEWKEKAAARSKKAIVSEIASVNNYYTAESYHQKYLERKGQSAAKGATSRIRCYG